MNMRMVASNEIVVENPSQYLRRWCAEYLTIDNPDYIKKEAMGKWTGNIPRELCLYDVIGGEVHLPFGVLKRAYRAFPDAEWINAIHAAQYVPYESDIAPYPYQEEAITACIRAKNGVLVMPCGSGKTQCGLEIIARLHGRALWLTHTQDLLNQSKKRAESTLRCGKFGTITAGKVDIGESITFATVQTMCKIDLAKYRDAFDVIICDECMPSNTLIDTPTGKKELKNLCIDDIIVSYNRNTKTLENKRVLHVFKNKAHDIVKVKLSNGEEIVCTGNHPIFTLSGQWIDAERLVQYDYVLRLVRQGSGNGCDANNIKKESIGKRVLLLFKGMFSKRRTKTAGMVRGSQAQSIGNDETNKQIVSQSVFGKNENKQSDERCAGAKSSFGTAESNWASSANQMRKRNRIDGSATNTDVGTCRSGRGVCGISDSDKNAKGNGISDMLQGGYCVGRTSDCDRGGWQVSLCDSASRAGQKERSVFEWVRVESVEIQKQTSDSQDLINTKKYLNKELEKAKNKLEKQKIELENAKNTKTLEKYADLLKANFYLIKPYTEKIDLVDYETQETITIPLNPKLKASENIESYYNKIKKNKRTIDILSNQIKETEKELEYYSDNITYLDYSKIGDLKEIMVELGLRKAATKKTKPHLAKYVDADNNIYYFGKNNFQNNYLTHEFAHANDYWFHAKSIPGSHVILVGELNEKSISIAANIAAYYSKARESVHVCVDYTLVKWVKKIKGELGSNVIYTHEKTAYADPSIDFINENAKLS